MKKICQCLTILIVLLFIIPVCISKAEPKTVTVELIVEEESIKNGEGVIDTHIDPFIVNNRIMMNIRFFPEKFNIKVDYDSSTRIITFYTTKINLKMYYDSLIATVNGKDLLIDTPYIIRGGRSFVPVRFIMETFGATVSWDPLLHKATIVYEIPEN